MEYICTKRYKKMGASGKTYNFAYGTKLHTLAGFIADGPEAVCLTTSEDAHRHFSRNDDGHGLERGHITYAIAYAPRGNGFRFTDKEQEILTTEFGQFLRPETEWILFNDDFFNADIETLRMMSEKLEVN